MRGTSAISALRAAAAAAAVVIPALFTAACSPQRETTPLPTKQSTIDPVTKKLDAAGEQERKRREEMEAATKQ